MDVMTILEWNGTILILIGIYFLNFSEASNPKMRLIGSIIVIMGCIILGIFAYIISAYGVMTTQIGVMVINCYGIFNCIKELKNKDNKL